MGREAVKGRSSSLGITLLPARHYLDAVHSQLYHALDVVLAVIYRYARAGKEAGLHEDGKILAALGADLVDDVFHKAEAVFRTAAVLVRALVAVPAQELDAEVIARGVYLHAVKARELRAVGALGVLVLYGLYFRDSQLARGLALDADDVEHRHGYGRGADGLAADYLALRAAARMADLKHALGALGVDGGGQLREAGYVLVVVRAEHVRRVQAERGVDARDLDAYEAEAALRALNIVTDAGVVHKAADCAAQAHGGHDRTVPYLNVSNFSGSEQTGAITG